MAFSPGTTQYLLNQVALSNSIRRLWVDNNQWTGSLIYSILYGQGDQDALIARLRQNADDFATIFSQFYNQQATDQLRQLINNDLDRTIRLAKAYKANDAQAIYSAREALYANANEVASYLSRINRYWDMATLQAMLNEIINLTEYEIMLTRDGQFADGIKQHDELINQSYKLSDELTYGILKQFQV